MSGLALPDFSRRSTEAEALDVGVPVSEAVENLADLRRVNRWMGTAALVARTIAPYVASLDAPRLLDVGSASGDLPLALAARFPTLRCVATDLKLLHLQQTAKPLPRVVADVHALPFAPRSFDVVTASLFLHHFDEPEAPGVLRSLHALCRRALVVVDLRLPDRVTVRLPEGRTLEEVTDGTKPKEKART